MDDKRTGRSSPKAGNPSASGSRHARLAAALKANLARRKAQARRRAGAASPAATAPKEGG